MNTIKFLDVQIKKLEQKINRLTEKKEFAEDKKFEKIVDEIRNTNKVIDDLNKCQYWIEMNSSEKYKVVVIGK